MIFRISFVKYDTSFIFRINFNKWVIIIMPCKISQKMQINIVFASECCVNAMKKQWKSTRGGGEASGDAAAKQSRVEFVICYFIISLYVCAIVQNYSTCAQWFLEISIVSIIRICLYSAVWCIARVTVPLLRIVSERYITFYFDSG